MSASIIQDFSFHPLMQRAQEALLVQLQRKEADLQGEIRECEGDLKRKSQSHQFLGVQLYQLQQKIAKTQGQLDALYTDAQSLTDSRLLDDEHLQNEKVIVNQLQKLVDDHVSQQQKYIIELEEQNETLKKMETYIREMKLEISITRNAMEKREGAIQKTEYEKEEQDKYVGNLVSQIDSLTRDIDVVSKRISSHSSEGLELSTVLEELQKEIAHVNGEKAQLMSKWKATLAGIGRRDEALAQVQATMTTLRNSLYECNVGIEVLKTEVAREQKVHESFVNIRGRLEHVSHCLSK